MRFGFIAPASACKSLKLVFRDVLLMLFFSGGLIAKSQSPVYSFTPADSQFVMEISRGPNEVIISLTFNDSVVFDNVSIEREPPFSQNFSQCAYFDYAELKKKGRKIIKKDAYPFPASDDVMYRIKLSTTDGAIRTYPAVKLPAVSK